MMNRNYMIEGTQSKMTPGLQVFRKAVTQERKAPKIRVAAYCRVSTDLDCQKSSLEIQMAAYNRIISQHPGWTLAGIYTDKGLSGTSAAHRVQFQKMIEDAQEGRIDYIIAKSTSRFARNTLDTLTYTRLLRDIGVGVYFEEQNIDTNTISSEMLLTIHAAFAQEESHSLSENLKKGVRSRFAMGIPKWSNTYGYRKVDDDVWVPEEEEAKVVRILFNMYLEGYSIPDIIKYLESERISPPGTRGKWYDHSISTILHNEKYVGDVLMQKNYTIDHMTHRRMKNTDATVPMYYKRDHHEAIVDRATFDGVQTLMALNDRHKGCRQFPYYGFLRCPFCGEKMVSYTLASRFHHKAWTCGGRSSRKILRKDRTGCSPFFIKEFYIDEGLVRAFRSLLEKMPKNADPYFISKVEKHRERVLASQIQYLFLCDLVKSITFKNNSGRIDWNTLVVEWRCGISTTGHIDYTRATDIPVTRDTAELRGMDYYANGEKTNGQTSGYYGIQALFDECDMIRIYEDNDSAMGTSIPAVIKPTTQKKDLKEELKYESKKTGRPKRDENSESGCLRKGKYA